MKEWLREETWGLSVKVEIKLMKSRTAQNGFNVISSFVAQNEILKRKAKWENIYLFDK